MKLILDHELIRITSENGEHRVCIAMSEGGWLEHNPFPGDLRGLVSAMSLAVDVLSGKFWIRRPIEIKTEKHKVIATKRLLESK